MNLASLFFAPMKTENLYPSMKVSEDHSSNPSTVTSPNAFPQNPSINGFRKIKKDPSEPAKIKEENNQATINNPFAQNLPQNMLKLLQIMGQSQKSLNQNLVSEPPSQSISKIQALFETLKAKKDEHEHKNNENKTNKVPTKLLQNVLLVNGNSENLTPKTNFLNKSLYVEFLASLYKQSKQPQKPNEDLNKILPKGLNGNTENFTFPMMKKENSLNNQEEKSDSDGLSNSNENLKGKSKKIKKVNLLCGHYTREHYAKNLCNNCYHKYGRTKKPWNCCHDKLYAHGLCQNCYINKYNQQKKNRIKGNENCDKNDISMMKLIEDDGQKFSNEEESIVKNEEKEDDQ